MLPPKNTYTSLSSPNHIWPVSKTRLPSLRDIRTISSVMRFLQDVSAFLPLLSCVSSIQFVIPEVESAVQSMLHNLSSYVDYKPPTNLPPQHVGPQSYVAQASTTPYWYETINHQGISAFGPSGYTVFRNVMSYGATGNGVTDDTVSISSLQIP